MPQSLVLPVLTVDTKVIHKVDTANAENLFSIWTVFARCRDSVAHGRRLENLSWRLWNRETFCCENGEGVCSSATSNPQNIKFRRGSPEDDIPSLSGSVDSLADEEAVDFSAESAVLDIVRPRIRREDSWGSSRSRGRERHITPDELEKMVIDIMQAKTPLDAPLPEIPHLPPMHEVQPKPVESMRSGSTTDEDSPQNSALPSFESLASESEPEVKVEVATPKKQTIVMRGFSPSPFSISRITSRPSGAHHDIPQPMEAPAAKIVQPKNKAKFAFGGSSGSGSDQDSYNPTSQLQARKQPPAQGKDKMFKIGNSSSEDDGSLQVPPAHLSRASALVSGQKKTASFNNEVVTQTFESSAISDGEDSDSDYVDESAIDDDDDEDWEEDSAEESGRSSLDEKLHFKRVDSSANLTSRRSLITLALANNNAQQALNPRLQKLNNTASQSTSALPRARTTLNGPMVASPNDSDEAPLMMKRGNNRPTPMRPINEIPRSSAQPINVTASAMHYQAALSPRTTRRNMLATELTESLRRSLLWERSTKSKTVSAALKRRHTSHDVANLKEYPKAPCMKGDNDNKDWNYPPTTNYHTQGW
ncbi:hypothetical protein QBC38DRAFT_6353 [Podospora fimiseda]|uniref:Nitrogen regulatory protein areA GATA-like domain-containing protein n=1 Tax=Podospora fimiseda TaxID=252190 RepID=A0AAN7H8N9_9PEZI|nr:hypothetical protein QBC38DRAFT_6353 [Podospora fimiseda]